MRITIESTDRFVDIQGVPARVWEGTSQAGVAVVCLVTRIAVLRRDDCTQFDRELVEQGPPSESAIAAFPLRMVL
jgi:hypothetical protein